MRIKSVRSVIQAAFIAAFILFIFRQMECSAADMSDADVDALFNRYPDKEWAPLSEGWEEVKSKMTTPVENLSLPLEYHPNGRMRARLFADKSQMFEEGKIFATGVKIYLYDDSGKNEGFLNAADCLFDKNSSHGYCKGKVDVKYGSDTLSGVGMYFSISGEYIKILSNGEIKTKRFQGNLGRLL